MEAVLKFNSQIKEDGIQRLPFNARSGSSWTLEEKWQQLHNSLYCVLNLRAERETAHRCYYADLEIFAPEDTLVLKKTSKGNWHEIKITYKLDDLMITMSTLDKKTYMNNPRRSIREIGDKVLQNEVKLYPILELSTSEQYIAAKAIKRRVKESLLSDLGKLFHHPTLNSSHDIVLESAGTRVSAHKYILAARLPHCWPLDTLKGSKNFKFGDLAAPGLRKFVSFLYDGTFQPTMIATAELAMVAKEMGVEEYKRLFFDKLMVVHLSTETVVYVIYVSFVCGEMEYYKEALLFLYRNFDQIQRTASWTIFETFFSYLGHINERLLVPMTDLEIIRATLQLVSGSFFEIL